MVLASATEPKRGAILLPSRGIIKLKHHFTRAVEAIAIGFQKAAEIIEDYMRAHQGYKPVPGQVTTVDSPDTSTLIKAWVSDGSVAVWRDDLLADDGITSRIWDGSTVRMESPRNATVGFAVHLESGDGAEQTCTCSLVQLTSGGNSITTTDNDLQDQSNRPIQCFKAQYLEQDSTSFFGSLNYSEEHKPPALRADGTGLWLSRPKANKFNGAILQDLLIEPTITVPGDGSQNLWIDIHVDKLQAVGLYVGVLTITDSNDAVQTIPIELTVRTTTLPDQNTQFNGAFIPSSVVGERFTGERFPNVPSAEHTTDENVKDLCYQALRQHGLDPVGDDSKTPGSTQPTPTPDAREADRLLGTLFTAARGYIGRGAGAQLKYRWLGAYRTWINWPLMTDTEDPANDVGNASIVASELAAARSWETTNGWTGTGYFYTIDEAQSAAGFALAEKYAQWADYATHGYPPMSTYGLTTSPTVDDAFVDVPSIQSYHMAGHCAPSSLLAVIQAQITAGKEVGFYNGISPAQGSMQMEETPYLLTLNPVMHAKAGLSHHFWWSAAYWRNAQGFIFTGAAPGTYDDDKHVDFRASAHTFGDSQSGLDESALGKRGWRRSLLDGTLLYPRTDVFFPNGVPGLAGVDVAQRLKHIRRGIQLQELIFLARAVDQAAADAVVDNLYPITVFDAGVANDGTDDEDRTWTPSRRHQDDINPDDITLAESLLMDIVEGV